jgi:hypothetical protein
MIQEDINLLHNAGWDIECESPFEIRHFDGSFAKDQAADIVLDFLRDQVQTPQFFVLRKFGCGTVLNGVQQLDIIGVTADEDRAKANMSVFCYYEPVISLDR